MRDARRPSFDAIGATILPPFRPRPPWWGGDLQTVRNLVVGPSRGAIGGRSERLDLAMRDGSGDRLAARLDRPWNATGRPLVVLIHGLTGCEDSVYMIASARFWLGRGHPVLRLNLRGAGPSRPLCRLQYHAGRTEDLADALAALEPPFTSAGMIAVGYSLGANMLLKFLGETGEGAPFRAAASVSAPIDLKATSRRFHALRNRLYMRYVLARMKVEALGPAAEVSAAERATVKGARTVYRFDDAFLAPRSGFRDADDYYERCMALRFLDCIRTPTVLVHARNDPWIPASAYTDYDWRANRALVPVLTRGGGHVGFHGAGSTVPWHDRAIAGILGDRLGI